HDDLLYAHLLVIRSELLLREIDSHIEGRFVHKERTGLRQGRTRQDAKSRRRKPRKNRSHRSTPLLDVVEASYSYNAAALGHCYSFFCSQSCVARMAHAGSAMRQDPAVVHVQNLKRTPALQRRPNVSKNAALVG